MTGSVQVITKVRSSSAAVVSGDSQICRAVQPRQLHHPS
eukprot:COSAG01_NODE_12159_length_1791_cov_1.632979_3_plen_38_part_01